MRSVLVIFCILAAVAALVAALRPGSPRTDDGVVCTADAKLCPDGSYVGRTGPRCEFAPCP